MPHEESTMTEHGDDLTRPADPGQRLSEYGWIAQRTESGGVRLRMRAALRAGMIGCWLGFLLLLGLFASFMYFVVGKPSGLPPDGGFFRVVEVLFSLVLAGTIGLVAVAIVLQILWLLVVREQWEVEKNRLEVRRRVLGLPWKESQYENGALIVEGNYRGTKEPAWHLALKSNGEKHYLIRETRISESGGFDTTHEAVAAMADVLAQHTGWPVTSVQHEAAETARAAAARAELPADLRKRGFRAGVDERLRLTIRPPALGRLIFGIVLVVLGGGWATLLADGIFSFIQGVDVASRPVVTLPVLLLAVLMPMPGVVAAIFGVVIIIVRECWIPDHDVFVVRSRLFGWKSEQQYVDGTFHLTRVCKATDDGNVWTWELQLQNQAGQVLKALRSDQDDDVPRLLGAVLSERTGWPLHEAEIPRG
jgi:hypothetical protein